MDLHIQCTAEKLVLYGTKSFVADICCSKLAHGLPHTETGTRLTTHGSTYPVYNQRNEFSMVQKSFVADICCSRKLAHGLPHTDLHIQFTIREMSSLWYKEFCRRHLLQQETGTRLTTHGSTYPVYNQRNEFSMVQRVLSQTFAAAGNWHTASAIWKMHIYLKFHFHNDMLYFYASNVQQRNDLFCVFMDLHQSSWYNQRNAYHTDLHILKRSQTFAAKSFVADIWYCSRKLAHGFPPSGKCIFLLKLHFRYLFISNAMLCFMLVKYSLYNSKTIYFAFYSKDLHNQFEIREIMVQKEFLSQTLCCSRKLAHGLPPPGKFIFI
ncbi:hypothetical protein CEXT_478741 [Caerostris extrusa]|uniref:Uncharacterized protein n=1 Tax=Caerostris extrusa TaxID=172846 RepID=A0AAV4Y1Z1_CAEEX|nr:hypothetical protein CEXT_478741 [Caerostris extrusa]